MGTQRKLAEQWTLTGRDVVRLGDAIMDPDAPEGERRAWEAHYHVLSGELRAHALALLHLKSLAESYGDFRIDDVSFDAFARYLVGEGCDESALARFEAQVLVEVAKLEGESRQDQRGDTRR